MPRRGSLRLTKLETEYRNFSWIVGSILMLVFGVFLPWKHGYEPRWWLILLGSTLAFVGTVKPAWLKYIYLAWMAIGHRLGRINTFILLNIFFYCILTPLALILRRTKWDSPVKSGVDKNISSYRSAPAAKKQMEEMF